jgi:DHA2 family multidrug resistance protein-like MFS transporter
MTKDDSLAAGQDDGLTADSGPKAGRKEWIGLGVLLLPLLLVSMDTSVLYFAVPFITRDLKPSSTQQLWMFDIYGFVLAGMLITMGALADRIGRRRLLIIGAVAFGAASVAAAYSDSAATLIAARAVLGIGGATLMPSTLALIRNMFQNEKQRGIAIAIWTGGSSMGVSFGPVLSGALLDHFWWGSVFLVNVPVMVLLVILAPLLLPESKNPNPGRFDPLSSVLSLASVLPIIYGIKSISTNGFSPLAVGIIVAGLVFGFVFIRRQFSLPDPMIDLKLLRNRAFGGSLTINTLAMFSVIGFTVFTTQYLQLVLGLAPLTAALWSLLPSMAVAVAAPTAAVLGQKMNRAYAISFGFLVAAVGYLVLTRPTAGSPLWLILIGASLASVGLVMLMVLVSDMALTTMAPERAGSASSLMETGQEFGGALGIALLGSIGTAVYRSTITHNLPASMPAASVAVARQTLGGALVLASYLPARAAAEVTRIARVAFSDGMHAAAIAAACVMVGGAVFSAVVLRKVSVAQGPAAKKAAADAEAAKQSQAVSA